mgnify:CR=1 FL=1
MAIKTTIDLPDELFVAAKREAAERRTTLRTLVERGLRAELSAGRKATPAKARAAAKIAWVTVDGGLPPGVDPADRASMIDRLRR